MATGGDIPCPVYGMDTNLGPDKLRVTIQIKGIKPPSIKSKLFSKKTPRAENGEISMIFNDTGFNFQFTGTGSLKGTNYRMHVSKLPNMVDVFRSKMKVSDNIVEVIIVSIDGASWVGILDNDLCTD